eukprot:3749365-Rhodomonas_salina.1
MISSRLSTSSPSSSDDILVSCGPTTQVKCVGQRHSSITPATTYITNDALPMNITKIQGRNRR